MRLIKQKQVQKLIHENMGIQFNDANGMRIHDLGIPRRRYCQLNVKGQRHRPRHWFSVRTTERAIYSQRTYHEAAVVVRGVGGAQRAHHAQRRARGGLAPHARQARRAQLPRAILEALPCSEDFSAGGILIPMEGLLYRGNDFNTEGRTSIPTEGFLY